jgi:pyruvate dehydrogenase (quinone)
MQEIELTVLFKDVAAQFVQQVNAPEQLPMVLDRAFRTAKATSSPCVVILPHDIQSAPAPELQQEHGVVVTAPSWSTSAKTPRTEDLDAAAAILNGAEKVALLVGQGARHAGAEVVAIAEQLGAGIATSLLGKPYVDETLPFAVGTMGHLGTTASAHLLGNCDALLIVGSNDPWTEFYPPPGAARAVQIDIDERKIGNRYPVDVGLAGDAAAALQSLSSRLTARPRGQWRDDVEQEVVRWRALAEERAGVPASPVNPGAGGAGTEWQAAGQRPGEYRRRQLRLLVRPPAGASAGCSGPSVRHAGQHGLLHPVRYRREARAPGPAAGGTGRGRRHADGGDR